MECSINEKVRLATIWLTNADQGNAAVQEQVKEIIAECRAKKIFVGVFHSGRGNLLENTKDLLICNCGNTFAENGNL